LYKGKIILTTAAHILKSLKIEFNWRSYFRHPHGHVGITKGKNEKVQKKSGADSSGIMFIQSFMKIQWAQNLLGWT
jgi:hypothetical protein